MSISNNIVLFPKEKQLREDNISKMAKNAIDEQIDGALQYHIDEAVNVMSAIILDYMNRMSFQVQSEEDFNDVSLIIESIRSYCSKRYNVHHPLQEFAHNSFIKMEDGTIKLIVDDSNFILPDDVINTKDDE